MISLDWDLSGFKKLVVIVASAIVVVWAHDPIVFLMWSLSAYYCWESHYHYVKGFRPYNALGGHLKKAINR